MSFPRRVRIIVKADALDAAPDLSTGRGGVLYADHFAPRLAALTQAVAEVCAAVLPAGEVVVRITEGWRPQRVPGRRDAHTELCALDYTIELEGARISESEYKLVAERTRAKVGDASYDFECHGVGRGFHIHGEFDPH
jgi:hypothetical protein